MARQEDGSRAGEGERMGRPCEAGIVGSAPREYTCPTRHIPGRSARCVVSLSMRRCGSFIAFMPKRLHSGCSERKRHSCWPDASVVRFSLEQNVAKGLEVAQEGTGRLLDATKDLLGGLAAVASRGVSWAADKISKTEAYKEWEKKPIGPRAKAVHEIAGSAFGGMITVSYGIRCEIPHADLPCRDFCRI
jgi:hypothetical protein